MRNADKDTVELHLSLRHSHPFGELAPYFRGLLAGRAMATRCGLCARTWFPPRLDCADHGPGMQWVELPGSGRVVEVTLTDSALPFGRESMPRVFALVALDGAENLAFARLADTAQPALPGQTVWISRAPGDWPHPSQAACYVTDARQRVSREI